MRLGHVQHQARQVVVILVDQLKVSERVAMPGVEAGGNNDQFRFEALDGRPEGGVERGEELLAAGAAFQRTVQRGAQPFAAARFLPAAGPWIPGRWCVLK